MEPAVLIAATSWLAVASGVLPTAGPSVRLIADENVYLRQGAGRKVLMVRTAAAPSGAPGDGTYAELWSTTW